VTDVAREFRLSAVRLWLWAGAAHALFFGLIVALIILSGRGVDWVAVATCSLVPALYWVVYALVFRAKVSADGLEWRTLSGVRAFARWDEMVGATRTGLLGLPQLQIELGGGRGVSWIFLVLTDPDGFREALDAFAGSDHPLTRAVIGERE
jgi:hypothetical protein